MADDAGGEQRGERAGVAASPAADALADLREHVGEHEHQQQRLQQRAGDELLQVLAQHGEVAQQQGAERDPAALRWACGASGRRRTGRGGGRRSTVIRGGPSR